MSIFDEHNWYLLAVLPMVELDEVAEGFREHLDHPRTILNRFVFEN